MGVPINDPNTPPLLIVKVPPFMSSGVILFSFPFLANNNNCFSMSAKLSVSQLRSTGTNNPLGVATATEMSMNSLYTISLPSITAFTTGCSYIADTQAFTKKLMKPNFTLCFLTNSSCNSFLSSMTPLMSTS